MFSICIVWYVIYKMFANCIVCIYCQVYVLSVVWACKCIYVYTYRYEYMFFHQRSRWCPRGGGFASRVWDCTLFLAFASLLAYDNKSKSYYVQVGSWWLGSGVASDWACLRFWGRHLFCR